MSHDTPKECVAPLSVETRSIPPTATATTTMTSYSSWSRSPTLPRRNPPTSWRPNFVVGWCAPRHRHEQRRAVQKQHCVDHQRRQHLQWRSTTAPHRPSNDRAVGVTRHRRGACHSQRHRRLVEVAAEHDQEGQLTAIRHDGHGAVVDSHQPMPAAQHPPQRTHARHAARATRRTQGGTSQADTYRQPANTSVTGLLNTTRRHRPPRTARCPLSSIEHDAVVHRDA
jgi:hypothetical protein